MSFPRITLPVIVVGSCLLNGLLLFVAVLAIFALLGHEFNLVMLWLIPLTLVVLLLALGIGLVLGGKCLFARCRAGYSSGVADDVLAYSDSLSDYYNS